MGGDAFRDRLRRLRRDAEPSAAPALPGRTGLPVWLRARLDRRRDPEGAAEVAPTRLPPARPGPPEALAVTDGPLGPIAARERAFDLAHAHGDWRLAEAFEVDPRAFELLAGDAALGGLDLRRAVFLDTETTGLSGGAGVYVYMVGLGTFEGERFHVWQGFLREPAEERALLAEVTRRIDAADSVVSFFGKSFDRHRLEDKMRVTGVAPPFADRPHLDLYHPYQRLAKGCFADGRLATIESQVCGVARSDDLPGSFAPAAWFDFLAGRPHRLEGVFRHNEDDVLSLVALAAHLGRALDGTRADGRPLAGPRGARERAVARALLARGERRAALPWLERAIELEQALGHDPRELLFTRAEALRRLGERARARAELEALAAAPPDAVTVPALEALAKLLEHDLGDIDGAHAACTRAFAELDRVPPGRGRARVQRDLQKRLARLVARRHVGRSRYAGPSNPSRAD